MAIRRKKSTTPEVSATATPETPQGESPAVEVTETPEESAPHTIRDHDEEW